MRGGHKSAAGDATANNPTATTVNTTTATTYWGIVQQTFVPIMASETRAQPIPDPAYVPSRKAALSIGLRICGNFAHVSRLASFAGTYYLVEGTVAGWGAGKGPNASSMAGQLIADAVNYLCPSEEQPVYALQNQFQAMVSMGKLAGYPPGWPS